MHKGRGRRSLYQRHRFTWEDAHRFEKAERHEIPCDWCGHPFTDEYGPHVDHDHHCACRAQLKPAAKAHCPCCTRGFVHHLCNLEIAAHEWREAQFHETSAKLETYRNTFPVTPYKSNK